MRLLLDENLSDRRLASRLQAQEYDPVLASDVGLLSITDARVLIWAIAQALPVLTRDSEDFTDLHDLIMAAGGHHPSDLWRLRRPGWRATRATRDSAASRCPGVSWPWMRAADGHQGHDGGHVGRLP